jgi:hypothetical protein
MERWYTLQSQPEASARCVQEPRLRFGLGLVISANATARLAEPYIN